MENLRILNGNDLKTQWRCFESDQPKHFEITLRMPLYCLIWNWSEDALKTGMALF